LQRPEQARSAFERARHVAEEQMRRMDGGVEAWANLAAAHERLGDSHLLRKDRRETFRDYEKAMSIREMLTQDDPREHRWAIGLAAICRKQGDLYTEENEPFTAVLMYDRQIGLLMKLLPDHPTFTSAIRATHEKMADLHRKLGNTKAAAFHDQKADQIAIP
jgi:hypothetical protein